MTVSKRTGRGTNVSSDERSGGLAGTLPMSLGCFQPCELLLLQPALPEYLTSTTVFISNLLPPNDVEEHWSEEAVCSL